MYDARNSLIIQMKAEPRFFDKNGHLYSVRVSYLGRFSSKHMSCGKDTKVLRDKYIAGPLRPWGGMSL